jgi:hypothetical protein
MARPPRGACTRTGPESLDIKRLRRQFRAAAASIVVVGIG